MNYLEEEMATHSGILAWRIPWTKEPAGLSSTGLQNLDTTEQLSCSKFSKSGFNSMWTVNFQMFVQAGFRKGRGTRDQISNIHWIIEKAREFQKNIYFCFIDYSRAFDCVDHSKLWKILQEMEIPDHLTCLLRNLSAGQEATVRTGHGTTDWFQIGKGVHQGCILSPCLFNFYAEYIMRNAGLAEAQAGSKISGRNINNLAYEDDTILMAESEEELKAS